MSCKVEMKGYVKKPNPTDKANVFQLSVKTGKDKATQKATYTWFQCRDSRDGRGECPKEDTYVVVKGGLSVSKNTKDGQTYTNLTVFVDDVSSPDNTGPTETKATPASAEPDPWD